MKRFLMTFTIAVCSLATKAQITQINIKNNTGVLMEAVITGDNTFPTSCAARFATPFYRPLPSSGYLTVDLSPSPFLPGPPPPTANTFSGIAINSMVVPYGSGTLPICGWTTSMSYPVTIAGISYTAVVVRSGGVITIDLN